MTTTPDVSVAGRGGLRLTGMGLQGAARRALTVVSYGLLPGALLTAVIVVSFGDHFAFDFHQFWQGGRDVVSGHSPYASADSLSSRDAGLDAVGIQDVFRFPYPAPAALAMAPFGALPFNVAASIFLLCSLAAIFLALRLLGVVDWRCYGLVFGSITTIGALRLGTFTPLLLLGLALAWRYRDRPPASAAAVACVIVAKLFLWPLLVWFLLTRRIRTAALTVALVAAITLGSWAVLGFAGLGDYPNLLSALTATVQGKGWSIVALGLSFGLPATTAKIVSLLVGCSVLAVAAFAPRADSDLWAFTLAIAAAILLTPIVWLHYFLLLVAPLAIAYPALAPAWFIALLFWVSPFQETGGDAWRISLGLAALASLGAAVLFSPRRPATIIDSKALECS